MSKAYAFLAEGHEEVENLMVVDLLRRGGIEVTMVSVTGNREVTGSHGITVKADMLLEEGDLSDGDLYFLPGGMPGTLYLAQCAPLGEILKKAAKEDKYLAAICAAPSVLGGLGLLEGKNATCYPGFEDKLSGAFVTGNGVECDGKILTARGLGYAADLGIELIRVLAGAAKAQEIKDAIQYNYQ